MRDPYQLPDASADWRERSLCRTRDHRAYWTDGPGVPTSGHACKSYAAGMCHGCPVILECAEEALRFGDRGVIRASVFLPDCSDQKELDARLRAVIANGGPLTAVKADERKFEDLTPEEQHHQYLMKKEAEKRAWYRWRDRKCEVCSIGLRPHNSSASNPMWVGRFRVLRGVRYCENHHPDTQKQRAEKRVA